MEKIIDFEKEGSKRTISEVNIAIEEIWEKRKDIKPIDLTEFLKLSTKGVL